MAAAAAVIIIIITIIFFIIAKLTQAWFIWKEETWSFHHI